MSQIFDQIEADSGQDARDLILISPQGFEDWNATLSARARAAVMAAQFTGKAETLAILPGTDAENWTAAYGAPDVLGVWDLAKAATTLPPGRYRLAAGRDPGAAALGWLLAHYKFTPYLSDPKPHESRTLVVPKSTDIDNLQRLAAGVARVRDMVNTPAEDMGPAAIEAETRAVAAKYAADVQVITGAALLEQNFPTIHAVGRAASAGREPRLIDLKWGKKGDPKLTIIGKGVSFDSGGLDIKTSAGMRLMKKDMGGAAHALALAEIVMSAGLRVRLRLLIPAVENSIDGSAFRPGDIIRTRKGITVEIGNTDAEGRLILCDALALGDEDKPDLLIDFATLTGAARVALGPDLPALFCNDDELAANLLVHGEASGDPLWRLPLWKPYLDFMKSDIADIDNAASGGFGGAITAALYLEKFIEPETRWVHLDTFAWMPTAKSGRPRGGEALGLRAFWAFLQEEFGTHRKA